ncbi:hypothetical protein HMN09_00946700 [Mycena chlorophos]|uniref:Cytochrome P450 n=1 Tax=Mycena chlorophos TaxID=658473 RepID=A0A8H6SKR9_MYCCL|nr:hypothetical protein HMN09_00946700 [Mycena chlorophos]
MAQPEITPIPQPRTIPFIGNLLDLQDEVPLHAIERLLDIYGPIVKMSTPAGESVVVGGHELVDQLCDETRFCKVPGANLKSLVKEGQPRSLFTALAEADPDWQQAHRILMPAFGPLAIEEMFEEMMDIGSQLILKWARQGSEAKFLVTEDMTRLTLDTIALCAMDYRFNSFYSETPHPFISAMNNTLLSNSNALQLTGIIKKLFPSTREQLRLDDELLHKTASDLVQYRRDHPTEKNDLLNAMVYGKDPKTGSTMRDALIAANMVTFLIAGHETTSGLLSFAIALLLLNPRTYFAARKEVDTVVGTSRLTAAHLKDLKYIEQVLRETLRLHPTVPAFARGVRPGRSTEIITDRQGRNFEVPPGAAWRCLTSKSHRDPAVWGSDVNEFVPERMTDEKFAALPKNAWKPFGSGMRACIGRGFAWQEAQIVLTLILQSFDLKLDDPNYQLNVVQTLTIKPKALFVRAQLREGLTATALQRRLMSNGEEVPSSIVENKAEDAGVVPLLILYGSNTGTCQNLAARLASEAAKRGFKATLADLDSVVGRIPLDRPVVVVTASYEGEPPDNAARFVAWLESLEQGQSPQLAGLKFAVFGVGHKDWAKTFQRIPTLVDDLLARHGGERLAVLGASDVSQRDVVGDFLAWTGREHDGLWASLTSSFAPAAGGDARASAAPMVRIEVDVKVQDRAAHLQQHVQWAKVVDARELAPHKHHIEFELPDGVTYTAGDYLAVLPLNPASSIKRVMGHFALPPEGVITIRSSTSATLPLNEPLRITDLLQGYVEFAQPANRSDLETLLQYTRDGKLKSELQALINDKDLFTAKITDKRVSVLDLLTLHKNVQLPFAVFLEMLPPLQTRYYSISSSPLANARRCTLTYNVIEGQSWAQAGSDADCFIGVSGSYLRSLSVGDSALVGIRSTNKLFRLPADPEKTPLVMICAGSGIAPFRGFIQERAVLIQEGGRKLAKAILFVGCRAPQVDRLYAEEIDAWVQAGVIDVRYAFSQAADANANASGCKYVQDRMLADEQDMLEMFHAGAKFYICAGPEVAKGVDQAARAIVRRQVERKGRAAELGEAEIEAFMTKMRNERFFSDIF